MAIVKFGYPNRVYFELFADQHPSEKIYSVQVKDWENFVKSEKLVAAVVQLDIQQNPTAGKDHLMVEPTAELVEFMNSRGIEIPDSFYIQPAGFTWDIVDIDIEEYNSDSGNKKSNIKAILAALAAAVALLS